MTPIPALLENLPNMQPMPCKPMFFDISSNYLKVCRLNIVVTKKFNLLFAQITLNFQIYKYIFRRR